MRGTPHDWIGERPRIQDALGILTVCLRIRLDVPFAGED